MSELAKMLTAVSTRRRVVEYPPISVVADVRDSLTPFAFDLSYSDALEYRITATLGSSVVAKNAQQLDYIIPSVKRRIIEHVFGEFRKPLMEVHHCIYERDFERADKLLIGVLSQMFEEGIDK